MGKHCISNSLAQCWHRQIRDCCIGYFPAKTCLCALSQHGTSNFFVQCCLRHIWKIFTKQCFYAVLSQIGIGYFPHKSCLLAMCQHCTSFPYFPQEKSRANIEQKDKIVRNSINEPKNAQEAKQVLKTHFVCCWSLTTTYIYNINYSY